MTRIARITTALAAAAAVSLAAPAALRAQDASLPTVAIMPFVNAGRATGARAYDGLGTSVADFLVTSLSANERLRVLPREQAQRAIETQRRSGTADRGSAQRAGRELNARAVIVGTYDVDARGFMRLDSRGLDVASGEVLFTERVQGRADDVVALSERLGTRMTAGLQWPPSGAGSAGAPLTAQQATLYGRALDFADHGDRARATESYEALLKDVPDYAPARRALSRLKPSP